MLNIAEGQESYRYSDDKDRAPDYAEGARSEQPHARNLSGSSTEGYKRSFEHREASSVLIGYWNA